MQRLLALIPAAGLFAFLIPYVLVMILPRLDVRFEFPSIALGTSTIALGCMMILIGAIYAFWSISAQLFQARGTPLPMLATQKLLITGPFKQCRNPMTFGTILLYLGISILVGSVADILFVTVFTGILLAYIKLLEEKELEARFGEAYIEYKAQTPFIIPRVLRRQP